VPDHIGVAVLGDLLPSQLATYEHDVAPVDVRVADNSHDRFLADLVRESVDVVVLESPVLDPDVVRQLQQYMQQADAAHGVIVYGFGRARDVDSARDLRIVALRAPVDVAQIRAAILSACVPSAPALPKNEAAEDAPAADWNYDGQVAPRRFNNQQLATLVQASTTIDCECPHHLAQLVGDLTAFEIYSANCANRDEDDAALHRYLHQTTAEARALIEAALERVADAEGIDY
jgi:hypothetical protein